MLERDSHLFQIMVIMVIVRLEDTVSPNPEDRDPTSTQTQDPVLLFLGLPDWPPCAVCISLNTTQNSNNLIQAVWVYGAASLQGAEASPTWQVARAWAPARRAWRFAQRSQGGLGVEMRVRGGAWEGRPQRGGDWGLGLVPKLFPLSSGLSTANESARQVSS